MQKAAQATLVGDVFDDAATGQGLLNYFLRAMNCGAITEDEAVEKSGLTLDELRSRSFVRILARRAADGERPGSFAAQLHHRRDAAGHAAGQVRPRSAATLSYPMVSRRLVARWLSSSTISENAIAK